ncbi:hypothetical protein BGX26_000717 [Mortierella sp. AD094]|nr:hypothetical protein BGX26_000717 [Mortierella sp. AD094]
MTTDTAVTLLASPFVSSASLSSILHGDMSATHSATRSSFAGTAAATTADSWRPLSTCSIDTDNTTTTTTIGIPNSASNCSNDSKPSSSRSRSRATDILLNLEASSNDTRFQGILHNTIALDHFRQFCFQEYSIENLLFWMDVELFAKPSEELLQMFTKAKKQEQECQQKLGELNEKTADQDQDEDESEDDEEANDKECTKMDPEQFAIQHARYIYLTYIDLCGPLQVNLSEESRTDIPWPILDHKSMDSSAPSSAVSSPRAEKKKSTIPWGLGSSNSNNSNNSSKDAKRKDEVVGWSLDRHMFDGAQEHTYQLMKGHTLVRFEESDLWKAVKKIMVEQPEKYTMANIPGPLNSHYKPDVSVILSTVTRSRSRHPSARPSALYNWNNSTTDLDRSRDKEEALAKTMSQYFGPIPPSIRHKGRVILGLGRPEDDSEDGFEDFDTYGHGGHSGATPTNNNCNASTTSKRSSTGSAGTKRNRFVRHLSGGITSVIGKSSSSTSEDLLDLYHDDSQEIDSIENGKLTTRWMVAGYFNDKVRLTAAQRKRLLRRNNKLTKFFGSRVDGTLRPVEELVEGGLGFGQFGMSLSGPSSAPTLGSPLAYALSSSTIHDMDKKGRGKKNKGNIMSNGGSGSELLLLLPGGQGTGSRSSGLLQRFKKNSGEFEDSNYRTFDSSNTPNYFLENPRSPTSTRGFFSYRKSNDGDKGGNGRHYRSKTAADEQHPRRILAHPHPLWSGSLSDQEGIASTAYERRRGLSIMSIMANNTPGAMPTTPTGTPTGFFGASRGVDQAGVGPLDRLDMNTRRKKADKLSTFFGAQLTTLELASQLPMENESSAVVGGGSNRSSNDTQSSKINGPTVSSENQLSRKERTILWKRNKKLRGLLGETLPESEVASALTRPVLMGAPKLRVAGHGPSVGRRSITGSKVLRKKHPGSLHSQQETRQQDGDDRDAESNQSASEFSSDEEYVDEGTSNSNNIHSNVSLIKSKGSKGKNRVAKRTATRSRRPSTVSVSSRSRRPSTVSVSSRKSQARLSRSGSSGLNRSLGSKSAESLLMTDSLISKIVDDSEGDDDDEIGYYDQDHEGNLAPGSPKYRRRKSSTRSIGLNVNTLVSASKSSSEAAMSRFNRKKRMDKIQQFLGDRVPEKDLWMGTVGREKTQEMLDMNLLSPTTTSSAGTVSSPPSFRKHGFPVSKSKSQSTGNVIADLKASSSSSNSGSGPTMTGAGEVKLERAQSLHSSRGKAEGQYDEQQQQQQRPTQARYSTAFRLRQQLASPTSPTFAQAGSISGIGQLIAGANVYSSPTASGPTSPTTVATMSPKSLPGPTPLTLLQDDDGDIGDESAEILPKLRAMSDKDQERFLKRAEKLEKMFGQFPPSALLLDNNSNNNNNNASPTLRFAEGVVVNGSSDNTSESAPASRRKSLTEHVGLFSSGKSRPNSSGSKKEKRFSAGSFRKQSQQQQQVQQQRSPERSSVDTVESLVISDTQFSCEL